MTAPIKYVPNFLSPEMATVAFDHLVSNLAWIDVTEARREYWTNVFDAPYTYGSGVGQRTYQPQPSDSMVDLVRSSARSHWSDDDGIEARWEGCFLNMYPNDKNALDWHADNAEMIDHDQPIAVVSLGAERPIMFRPIGNKDPKAIVTKLLGHGSLLLMEPGMQFTHLHKIPRGSAPTGPRISLTYRSLRDA